MHQGIFKVTPMESSKLTMFKPEISGQIPNKYVAGVDGGVNN